MTQCHCGAHVLIGWAEGIRTRVDPVTLTHAGHIAAILDRRRIYRLTSYGLVHIDSHRIGQKMIRGPLVPQHRCRTQIPTQYRNPPAEIDTPTDTEEPPF